MSADPSSPLWLDEAQQRHWRAYLRGGRMLEAALDRDLQCHGVSLAEYEIVSMLSEAPEGHLRMAALADLVVQSRSRLTHTAVRLEGRGWVRRRPSSDDRRGVDLVLTEAGRTALAGLAEVHVGSVRQHLLDHLTPSQLAALGEAMAAVGSGILGRAFPEPSRSGTTNPETPPPPAETPPPPAEASAAWDGSQPAD